MHILDCSHIVESICADLSKRQLAACISASRRFFQPAVCALYKSVTPVQLDLILAFPFTYRTHLYRESIPVIRNVTSIDSMMLCTAVLPSLQAFRLDKKTDCGTKGNIFVYLERFFAPGPTLLMHYRAHEVTVVDRVSPCLTELQLGYQLILPARVLSLKLLQGGDISQAFNTEARKTVKSLFVDLHRADQADVSCLRRLITRAAQTLTEITILNQGEDVFNTIARCCTGLVRLIWECDESVPGLDLSVSLRALSNLTRLEMLQLGWILSIGGAGLPESTASNLRSPTFKSMRQVKLNLAYPDISSLLKLSLLHFPIACGITTYQDAFDYELKIARRDAYNQVFAGYGWSHVVKQV